MLTMNPATADGAPYFVPREPNRWSSMTMAVIVHAGLLLCLYISVRWQNTAPVQVEAEVWDIKVQSAAAPPVPEQAQVAEPIPPVPAPAPEPEPVVAKAPDIALERAKQVKEAKLKAQEEQKRKLQEKKLLDDKLAKEKLAKELAANKLQDKQVNSKKAIEEQKALDKAREAEMRRITGATGAGGEAPKATAPRIDSGYVASLVNKIRRNIVYTGSTEVAGDPRAIYRIEQLPTGDIISVKKIKSSGVPEYDRAVENAINASSPLPKKKDGTVERTIEPEFRLKDLP
jgi:colicin import membrane protein